jgi:hypothetical protein
MLLKVERGINGSSANDVQVKRTVEHGVKTASRQL